MSRALFSEVKQNAYISGVANALDIEEADVKITSITEETARRRLLAQSVVVGTTVTTTPERVQSVSAAVTPANLNIAMAAADIEVSALSEISQTLPDVLVTPVPELGFLELIPTWALIAAPSGLALLIIIVMVRRNKTSQNDDQEQHHSHHHHHKNTPINLFLNTSLEKPHEHHKNTSSTSVSLSTSRFQEHLKANYSRPEKALAMP
jgi:hypothetical protein